MICYNTEYAHNNDFHQIQKYLRREYDISEKWFYNNCMFFFLVNVNSLALKKFK